MLGEDTDRPRALVDHYHGADTLLVHGARHLVDGNCFGADHRSAAHQRTKRGCEHLLLFPWSARDEWANRGGLRRERSGEEKREEQFHHWVGGGRPMMPHG